MKTPTKEQIKKIYDDVFYKPYDKGGPYRMGYLADIERVIISWEKIRGCANAA